MTHQIITNVDQRVLNIRIDREAKKNALTGDMYHALSDALNELANNNQLRVALITGTQSCFTAGNDLADFLEQPEMNSQSPAGRFLTTLANLSKPLVAAVNGPAVGIGTTLLLHCDLVYATAEAYFQLPFVNLGLCPEAGSSLLLPQRLGQCKAAELLLLGERFNAQQALAIGLVNEVVDTDQYQHHAQQKALQLAAQPAKALQVTRQLLRQGNQFLLDQVIQAEMQHFNALLKGDEAQEALTAFREKRKPNFSKT